MNSELHVYEPPERAVKNAWVSGMDAYRKLVAEAELDHEAYWARLAKELISWRTPFKNVLDASKPPFFRWFDDGTSTPPQLPGPPGRGQPGGQTAIIFEPTTAPSRISYQELLDCHRLANALKARGVVKGDRVVIYMPMSIERGRDTGVRPDRRAPLGGVQGFSASSLRPDPPHRRGAGDHRRRAGARRRRATAEGDRRRGPRRLGHGARRHRLPAHRRRRPRRPARQVAARAARRNRPAASPVGRRRASGCSCSTPRAPPASPRVQHSTGSYLLRTALTISGPST